MTWIVGDVHGHVATLRRLVATVPPKSRIVFVGDLIDRGPASAQVVALVRAQGWECVAGNHEALMIEYGGYLIESFPVLPPHGILSRWLVNGGRETLESYGLATVVDGRLHLVDDREALERFEQDRRWMAALPVTIMLDAVDGAGRPIVVSHACVAEIWRYRDDPSAQDFFREEAQWSRGEPRPDVPIYNIFGHTPVAGGVKQTDHFANVDTGCYRDREGFGRLSALNAATGETRSVPRLPEE